MNYGFETTVGLSVDDAEDKICSELKKEGFGLVSRINMKEKFKEKLNIDYHSYIIMGFCNPSLAYEAVEVEENIGLLLPCNVIVFEKEGKTKITFIKPSVAMSMVENQELGKMADKIEKRLKIALENI